MTREFITPHKACVAAYRTSITTVALWMAVPRVTARLNLMRFSFYCRVNKTGDDCSAGGGRQMLGACFTIERATASPARFLFAMHRRVHRASRHERRRAAGDAAVKRLGQTKSVETEKSFQHQAHSSSLSLFIVSMNRMKLCTERVEKKSDSHSLTRSVGTPERDGVTSARLKNGVGDDDAASRCLPLAIPPFSARR